MDLEKNTNSFSQYIEFFKNKESLAMKRLSANLNTNKITLGSL